MKLTKVESQKDFDTAKKTQMSQLWDWWDDLPVGEYTSENGDVVKVEGIEEDKRVFLNGEQAFEYVYGTFYNIDWEVSKKLIS